MGVQEGLAKRVTKGYTFPMKPYNVHPLKHPRYPWKVEYRIGKERKKRHFKTKKDAETWADARNKEARNSGVNAIAFPEEDRVESIKAKALLAPYNKSLIDAAIFFAAHLKNVATSIKVKDAVDKFLAEKGRDRGYQSDLKSRLTRLKTDWGETFCAELSAPQIRNWLITLRGLKVKELSPLTRNNYRRVLSTFFSYCTECGWMQENFMDKIKPALIKKDKVAILTPEQAAKLLANATPKIAPFIAIGLFCGLRRSELQRVGPHSVRTESGLIEANVTKTRGAARRFIRIRPCLAAWLKKYPIKAKLSDRQFRKGLSGAIEDAGLIWPHNAIRHSFCSYALAHDKNLNELVLEMGHTNPHTLYANYRELVTPEDAAVYWSLSPAGAEKVARSASQNSVASGSKSKSKHPKKCVK